MKESISGSFYKNSEAKRPIHIRGFLGDFLGPIGREGNIGFYDIEIKCGEKFKKTNMRVCIKELSILSVSEHKESRVTEVLKKHSYLKQIGLPVVPVCRGDAENNLILMTDMTKNDKNIIIDKHNPLEDFEIVNMCDLKTELFSIAESAYYEDVFLSMDAYSIVVDRKTKKGKVSLIDIGARSCFLDECDEFYINEKNPSAQVNSFLKISNLIY